MSNHNALMFAFAALLALSVPPFAAAADNTATPPGPPPPLSATQPPPGPRIPPASNIGGFVAEYQSKAFVYTEYTNMLKALKDACATGYAPIDWCTKPDVPPPQTNDDKDKREPNHTQPPSATLPALSQHIGVPHLSAIRGSRPHLQATFTWDDGSVLTVGVNATLPGAIKVTDIQEYCVFLSEGGRSRAECRPGQSTTTYATAPPGIALGSKTITTSAGPDSATYQHKQGGRND